MKCLCCDRILTDKEATRKHTVNGEYLDTCNSCLREIETDLGFSISNLEGDLEEVFDEDIE
jgi:hypothetical protein